MDYQLLKKWESEVKELTREKKLTLLRRLDESKPLFGEPYLQWMFGIKHKEPIAFNDCVPSLFHPSLWFTLPFFKLNLVMIPDALDEKEFKRLLGMDVETFMLFHEYGKVQPLIAMPTAYKGKHFLDPILRESPPCNATCRALDSAITSYLDKATGNQITTEAKKLFPGSKITRRLYTMLRVLGFEPITTATGIAIKRKEITKEMAQRLLFNAFVFYAVPYISGGGATHILTEQASNQLFPWGKELKRTIKPEVREEILGWLGFKLPGTLDRSYVSKYIDVCDDLSPSLYSVVSKIENKVKGYREAKGELHIIIQNLENELALITRRRKALAGAMKWITGLPFSITEDMLKKATFKETGEDIHKAKLPAKDWIEEKVGGSIKAGEIIAMITHKKYIVRSIWKIKEKTKELSSCAPVA